jgi:hypothetical protein
MVSKGKEVVGLEVSGCCVVSSCCSNAGENVVSESVWKFRCARQQDMVTRGREVVGLEVSGCCVVSTCCSKAGENVVSEGVAFTRCDMVEKACCAGSSCKSKGPVSLELFGKQIVVARFLMITVKF